MRTRPEISGIVLRAGPTNRPIIILLPPCALKKDSPMAIHFGYFENGHILRKFSLQYLPIAKPMMSPNKAPTVVHEVVSKKDRSPRPIRMPITLMVIEPGTIVPIIGNDSVKATIKANKGPQ